MCCDPEVFHKLVVDSTKEVVLANGSVVCALGHGDVHISLVLKFGKIKSVEISDVLFVPALEENLLSVRKLTEKGNLVIFEGDACYIAFGREKWNVATFGDGLYRVRARTRNRAHSAIVSKSHCVHEWHLILAHRNL